MSKLLWKKPFGGSLPFRFLFLIDPRKMLYMKVRFVYIGPNDNWLRMNKGISSQRQGYPTQLSVRDLLKCINLANCLLGHYCYCELMVSIKASLLPMRWTTWAYHRHIARDEALYPNAKAFIPERFLGPTTLQFTTEDGKLPLDPTTYVFGYGRRWNIFLDVQRKRIYRSK